MIQVINEGCIGRNVIYAPYGLPPTDPKKQNHVSRGKIHELPKIGGGMVTVERTDGSIMLCATRDLYWDYEEKLHELVQNNTPHVTILANVGLTNGEPAVNGRDAVTSK